MATARSEQHPLIDINLKYVRLIQERNDGFVEFEFAIGEPDLCAEMLMPADAYEAFCRINGVIHLPPRQTPADAEAASDWTWNLHQATHQRFR